MDISNYKIDFRDYNKPAKAMPLFSSVVKSYQEENIEANQNTEKKPGRNARRREAKWRKRDGQQEPAKASSTAVLEQKPAQLMAKVGTFRKNPNAEKGSNDDVKSVNQHLQEGF